MLRWFRKQLELDDAERALADRVADAVGAGVAAAHYDNVLALGRDLRQVCWRGRWRLRPELLGDPAVAAVEILHCEVNSIELAAGHVEVTRHARTDRQHNGVKVALQLVGADVGANIDAVANLNPFVDQLRNAAVDHVLLNLKVGDTKANQAAGRLVALKYDDLVAGAAELLRCR